MAAFRRQGVLIKPLKTPRDAKALFAACEKALVTHLKAACLWPKKERNESWRVGITHTTSWSSSRGEDSRLRAVLVAARRF